MKTESIFQGVATALITPLTEKGVDNYILYAVGNSSYSLGKRYMSPWEIRKQAIRSRIFGNYGFQSKRETGRLIRELEQIMPDVVHLHNLHSHNVHLGMLFSWLKKKKIKITCLCILIRKMYLQVSMR